MDNESQSLPERIDTVLMLAALAQVTGEGVWTLKRLFKKRMHDNRGDGFAALVDFLDDCMKIKKHERRTQR